MSIWSFAPNRRTAPWWMAAAALGLGTGLALTVVAGRPPGSEAMTLEDAVDMVGWFGLGLLGWAVLRRGVADRLGQALVLFAALTGLDSLMSGMADVLAHDREPPVVARLLNELSETVFISSFVLLVLSPLLLFPTGRLPSARWRWAPWAGLAGFGISALSVLLTPGPLDEDVPAWGENPLGVSALDGAIDPMTAVGAVLVLAAVLGGLAAYVVRCVRYRGRRRRQMAWFTLAVVPMVGVRFLGPDRSLLGEVVSAVVVFGGLIVGMGWPLLTAPRDEADAPGRGSVRASSAQG